MRGWSFTIGTVFGVEIRLHLFIFILLGLTISYGVALDHNAGRGFVLWLLLIASMIVRETARAAAAAWCELKLRGILLLPTGGLATYASGEETERAATIEMQRRMLFAGPAANLLFGLALAGLIVTIAPSIDLLARPWVVPGHLLRSFVWVNLLLGVLHLCPGVPLDGGRLFRAEYIKARGTLKGVRVATWWSQAISFALMAGGLVFSNIWMTLMGSFLLVEVNLEEPGLLTQGENDTVKMRDVMLVEYSTLSASDTLEDALERCIHVLQDVFPVVRGANMVGAVSRQSIVEALAANGNGYIQGVMTRSFQTAHPDDSLVKTLRRIMAGQGAQLLPVLDGERIVGIITPQNLAHSMSVLSRSRRFRSAG